MSLTPGPAVLTSACGAGVPAPGGSPPSTSPLAGPLSTPEACWPSLVAPVQGYPGNVETSEKVCKTGGRITGVSPKKLSGKKVEFDTRKPEPRHWHAHLPEIATECEMGAA